MVPLVELLGQLVAVVGDATWRVVLTRLFHSGGIVVHLLYKFNLLPVELSPFPLEGVGGGLCLTQDTAYSCVGILNERSCVAVKVYGLLRVEEHILACINLQYEVLQCSESYDACYLLAFLFRHIVELTQFVGGATCIFNHCCYEVVGIDYCTLATLHLSVRQFHHTVREVYQFLSPLES